MGSRPQLKTLKSVQRTFSGVTKQMIIEFTPTMNKKHLLVGLTEDKVVTPKKMLPKKGTPDKRPLEEEIEEVEEGFQGRVLIGLR